MAIVIITAVAIVAFVCGLVIGSGIGGNAVANRKEEREYESIMNPQMSKPEAFKRMRDAAAKTNQLICKCANPIIGKDSPVIAGYCGYCGRTLRKH